jgi:hypothetical protein
MEVLLTIKEFSLLFGIWLAIYSIDSWRREHKGKRQIELVEETLALFYEARDVVASIRHPISFGNESDDIKRGEKESDDDYDARKRANIVFSRYKVHQELFNKIHSMRYRFMAQIGKDEAVPFDELREIKNEIFRSAQVLARLWPRNQFRTDEAREKHLDELEKHEAIFWDSMNEDDPINGKLEKTICEMESTCKNVIAGAGTLYGFINFSFNLKSISHKLKSVSRLCNKLLK